MNDTHSAVSLIGSGRLPLPTTTYIILPTILLSFVVALRPGLPIRIAIVILHVWWMLDGTKYSGGGGYNDWLKGSFLGSMSSMAVYALILTDPMIEWRHNSYPDTQPIELPFWQRMYWVLCAVLNNRGLKWSFEVPYIPLMPSFEYWPFLIRRTRQLLWNLLLVEIAQTYERLNPVFAPENTASMWSQGLVLGYLNLLARLLVFWGMFNIPYCWLSLACVATGMHEPRDWPDTFGNWADAYTIRRFWSRCWHQRIRRFIATAGKSAARLLYCKPGTWLSARVQLIVGFGLSALVHFPGDLMVNPSCAGASALFFLWQIVAITFEDFVIDMGGRYGLKERTWTHIVGWIWTFGWFVVMTGKFVEWTFLIGAGMHEAMRFSVIRPLLDYMEDVARVNVEGYIASVASSM
ncbi:membrane bound O-acyl transferase family-domain-containing protein [Irpex lacteus]|nr:membrane bound O-acyl transferase family-domain-containing protein [Irpex lacteus]